MSLGNEYALVEKVNAYTYIKPKIENPIFGLF